MKIIDYSPFLNENRVLEIKLKEASRWMNEVHLCEAPRTFSYEPKSSFLDTQLLDKHGRDHPQVQVKRHQLEDAIFQEPPKTQIYYDPERNGSEGFDAWYWRLLCGNAAYHNEAMQRNYVERLRYELEDDDIVILSDVDEIIDSRFAGQIISAVRQHGIITVKLHFSVFYLNLFATSNHGVPDFAYRVYIMTGRYFRTMPFSPDYLRKRGIEGGFLNEIPCLETPMGFHHSWLEPDKNALAKLQAFQANVADQSMISNDYINQCINDKKLHYLDAELQLDNSRPFLSALNDIDLNGLNFPGSSLPLDRNIQSTDSE